MKEEPQGLWRAALSRKDASESLSISTRTLDRLVTRGKIRSIKVGERTVIPKAEILRYINEEMEAQRG